MTQEGKFGHDFSEYKQAHAELQKTIRSARAEIESLESGAPNQENKNAQLLDDLDPAFIKADAIERTSKAFDKSMQVDLD